MTSATAEGKAERLDELLEYLRGRLAAAQTPGVEHFVTDYYQWVAPEFSGESGACR
jgi:hypothetical protein